MTRTRLLLFALPLLFVLAGSLRAQVTETPPPAPQQGPVAGARPFPKAVDATQFTQWFLETRQALLKDVKAARARGDRAEVARILGRLQDVRHHVVMELRRLEKPRPKAPVRPGVPASRPASRPAPVGS